jgi:hypothetical protein
MRENIIFYRTIRLKSIGTYVYYWKAAVTGVFTLALILGFPFEYAPS